MRSDKHYHPSRSKYIRVNKGIHVAQLRLIDKDGEQIGIVDIENALERARESGLDLVEVAPNAKPPVCKIMDYGKYKYEIAKKEKDSKKKQHTITVKEIRLRPKIEKHDFDTKVKHARKFLEHGARVKVLLLFRGREVTHIEFGKNIIKNFQEALEDIAKIESPMSKEGHTLVTVLSKK